MKARVSKSGKEGTAQRRKQVLGMENKGDKVFDMKTELLKTAEEDLKAAKILYENKLYPQSIFYFQQSVEKAAKYVGLLQGHIKEDDLKPVIGHMTINIYEKMLTKLIQGMQQVNVFSDTHPDIKNSSIFEDLSTIRKETENNLFKISNIKENQEKIIYISVEEIDSFIEEIKLERKKIEKKKMTRKDIRIFKNKMSELSDFLSELGQTPNQDISKIKEFDDVKLEKIFKEMKKFIPSLIEAYLSLFLLAVITFPHARRSRYPIEKSLTEIYNDDLPIIKIFPKLIKLHSEALDEFVKLEKSRKQPKLP